MTGQVDTPVEIRAQAKWVRMSARKARIVLDNVRGLTVPEARTVLAFTPRAAAIEIERVLLTCRATIGTVGNSDHANESSGKAGRSRWLGKRPAVRGTAMNPVDHPHGGGEGKSKGHHPVTPWGVPTLGKRTRRKHKESDKLIVRGRRRGKERR